MDSWRLIRSPQPNYLTFSYIAWLICRQGPQVVLISNILLIHFFFLFFSFSSQNLSDLIWAVTLTLSSLNYFFPLLPAQVHWKALYPSVSKHWKAWVESTPEIVGIRRRILQTNSHILLDIQRSWQNVYALQARCRHHFSQPCGPL